MKKSLKEAMRDINESGVPVEMVIRRVLRIKQECLLSEIMKLATVGGDKYKSVPSRI